MNKRYFYILAVLIALLLVCLGTGASSFPLYSPEIPADLKPVSDLRVPLGDIHLFTLHKGSPHIELALQIPNMSLDDMIWYLAHPHEDLIKQYGFLPSVPEFVKVDFLGMNEDTLYVLTTYDGIPGSYIYSEEMMDAIYDSLVLSLSSFSEFSKVQFVEKNHSEYRGRHDLVFIDR